MLAPVPSTVRVNVTPNGVSYTLVSSTGTVTAKTPDGAVLYRGLQRLLVRVPHANDGAVRCSGRGPGDPDLVAHTNTPRVADDRLPLRST